MSQYLTVAEFRARTIMPNEQIDEIEAAHPGWLDAQFGSLSAWIDMRLAKRYRVPFPAATEQLRSWVSRLVTVRAFLRLGVTATDAQLALVSSDADKAEAEVREAADGQLGLIDLPATDTGPGSAVSVGGTRAYSEASPYVSLDVQRDRARLEDQRRRGT